MYARRHFKRCLIALAFLVLGSSLSGCTQTEEAAVITQLQSALSDLAKNRELTEQFVRDIKTTVEPSNPGYATAMDSYQEARDSNDHFLDGVESSGKPARSRALRNASPLDVQSTTAAFMADATNVLKPDVNTRHIPFKRAIVIPSDLQATLHKLPRKDRERIIDNFDKEVRWRSWDQL
jgi:hypothetical protein